MSKYNLRDWAKDVKVRDGKCMRCGEINDLHAHHIKPKASHPELLLDLENGSTLCYRCHKAEHDRNRPTRIRSTKPHRNTLGKVVNELTQSLKDLQKINVALRKENTRIKAGMCADCWLKIKHQ